MSTSFCTMRILSATYGKFTEQSALIKLIFNLKMVEGECGGNDEDDISSRPRSEWIAILNYPQHSHAQGTNTSDCPSVMDRVSL